MDAEKMNIAYTNPYTHPISGKGSSSFNYSYSSNSDRLHSQ